jgi:hypothetical protein
MACAEQPIRSDKTSPRRGAARSRVSTFVAPSQSFRTTIFAADASADKSRPQPAKTDANTAVSILHPEWIKATRILWTIFCSCMPGMFQRILEVLAEFDYFSAGVRAGLRTVIVVPHGNGREQNAAMRGLGEGHAPVKITTGGGDYSFHLGMFPPKLSDIEQCASDFE